MLRQDLDVSLIELGDVLYFLKANYKIPDEPLMIYDGVSYWPWHTGLFAGEGRVLHAQPGGRVRHQDLVAISFDALYVTRIP